MLIMKKEFSWIACFQKIFPKLYSPKNSSLISKHLTNKSALFVILKKSFKLSSPRLDLFFNTILSGFLSHFIISPSFWTSDNFGNPFSKITSYDLSFCVSPIIISNVFWLFLLAWRISLKGVSVGHVCPLQKIGCQKCFCSLLLNNLIDNPLFSISLIFTPGSLLKLPKLLIR